MKFTAPYISKIHRTGMYTGSVLPKNVDIEISVIAVAMNS